MFKLRLTLDSVLCTIVSTPTLYPPCFDAYDFHRITNRLADFIMAANLRVVGSPMCYAGVVYRFVNLPVVGRVRYRIWLDSQLLILKNEHCNLHV